MISKYHKLEYEGLKKEMLFACIWKERPQGGYNSFDYRPFVALKKVNNQGVDAYEGKYINSCKSINEGRVIIVEAGEVYKPLPFFTEDGNHRIIVSNDLDEIAKMYLERWEQD